MFCNCDDLKARVALLEKELAHLGDVMNDGVPVRVYQMPPGESIPLSTADCRHIWMPAARLPEEW